MNRMKIMCTHVPGQRFFLPFLHFQKYKLATNSEAKSESPLSLKKRERRKRKKLPPQHAYDKWIKMSKRIREEDVTRKAQLKDVAKFLKQLLPSPTVQNFESRDRFTTTPPSVAVKRRAVKSLPSTSAAVETVYETNPAKPKFELNLMTGGG